MKPVMGTVATAGLVAANSLAAEGLDYRSGSSNSEINAMRSVSQRAGLHLTAHHLRRLSPSPGVAELRKRSPGFGFLGWGGKDADSAAPPSYPSRPHEESAGSFQDTVPARQDPREGAKKDEAVLDAAPVKQNPDGGATNDQAGPGAAPTKQNPKDPPKDGARTSDMSILRKPSRSEAAVDWLSIASLSIVFAFLVLSLIMVIPGFPWSHGKTQSSEQYVDKAVEDSSQTH